MRFARSASFGHCEYIPRWRGTRTHGAAKGAQLPIEDTNHTILCRVEDQVVQFIVSVNDSGAGLRFVGEIVGIPFHKLIKAGNLSDGFVGLGINHYGLCERDSCQRFYLAREIGVRWTEALEAELLGRKRRECSECADCGEPADFSSVSRLTEKEKGSPLSPVLGFQLGHIRVGEYPTI